jgi:ATPase subunit of ABC transporter with duplicated ATPase domains
MTLKEEGNALLLDEPTNDLIHLQRWKKVLKKLLWVIISRQVVLR